MPERFEEILDICIERVRDGSATLEECIHTYPQHENALRELLPLAVSINALQQTQPTDKFSRNARGNLLAKLPEQPVTFWGSVRHMLMKPIISRPRRFSMTQIIISVIAAIGLIIGGSFGVQASAPGDLFYTLDRGLETARLMITANFENMIALRLQYAAERLEEVETTMAKGDLQNALAALEAHGNALQKINELIENEQRAQREALRTMAQEEIGLQQGTLDRIRLNMPEDAQARSALQHALQRSNMSIDTLLGPPEFAPQGPPEEVPQGPANEDAQGPNEEAPQGPPEEAPQGPGEEQPNGPNDDAPQGPTEEAPQGPNEDAPHGP